MGFAAKWIVLFRPNAGETVQRPMVSSYTDRCHCRDGKSSARFKTSSITASNSWTWMGFDT
jgi:hypothetical protein